jgi:hypothetical protein
MDFKDILTEQEAQAYTKAREKFKRLKEDLIKETPKLDKTDFARSGATKSLELFSSNLTAELKKFWALITEANRLYAAVKKGMDESGSTHEFITLQALVLLGIDDPTARKKLQKACTAPDREKELNRLAFEGHFYGKVGGRRNGNFFERIFGDPGTGLLGFIDRHVDDIDETALSNFMKYYIHAKEGDIKLKELGWAAHYIQDITAPHHAGNMAIGFEIITDDCETHFQFEKYAKAYVYANPTAFMAKAKGVYDELTDELNPDDPVRIAKEVHRRAVPNIPKVQILDDSAWKEAIDEAIPLAIGATAFIFEPLKQV